MDRETRSGSSFYCDMSAKDPATRMQHLATTRDLFAKVRSIEELANGYAFWLPSEAACLTMAAEFIVHEKECCPFLGFTLVIKPEGGQIWLHITGPEGVKPFIQAELGGVMRKEIAQEFKIASR